MKNCYFATDVNVIALCCTHGRYKCLQRSVRCFLDQDYKDCAAMVIYNSGDSLELSFELMEELYCSKKKIIIFNVKSDSYNSVGEKYTHALKAALDLFPNASIIYSHDDDDIYLPNHITEGVKGMQKALLQGKYAYKPKYSYYRSDKGIIRNENTYEPSIFVETRYLQQEGYAPVSIRYHQQWLDPLVVRNAILVDPDGISTFIYNWGDPWRTYKMSGTGDDSPMNMYAHKRNSIDMGNGILIPNQDNSYYYNEIEHFK